MKLPIRSLFILAVLIIPTAVHADTVDLSKLTGKGIAIYGWRNGVPTVLYQKKQQYLFPVASITKLATAKAAVQLYPATMTFVMSPEAMLNTYEDGGGILPGMTFTRDDMLRALLVSSNNGVANQLLASAPAGTFLAAMNAFLHDNKYTTTSFVNPSGLDPEDKKIMPNRLTPKSVSYMLSDMYRTDPLLVGIMKQKEGTITDMVSGTKLNLRTSNRINRDDVYKDKIIISKTGITDLSGQSLAFVTSGEGKYDYITVVFLGAKNRYADGILIIDWLQQVLHF